MQVGNPHRKVLSLIGDGGFMYTMQELATAKQHGINLVTVIFNDNAYGNVKRIQQRQFGGRTIASDVLNPDFVQLARALGIDGRRAHTPEDLEDALRAALAGNAPAVIEVPVGEMPDMYQLLNR